MFKKMKNKIQGVAKKYRILIIILLVLISLVYFNPGKATPVEKIEIPSGIGWDVYEDSEGNIRNHLSASAYTFNEKDKTTSMIDAGDGSTIPETRETRQIESNRKLLIALQKVILMSEDSCRYGITPMLDILFANQFMNDTGWIAVCKGKSSNMLKVKVDQYPSAADFIDGLIENSKEHDFFTDNYKIMDLYVRADAEGRNIALPYLEITNGKIKISGMALFKKDKMVAKIDLKEAKIMNLLRENKATGILEMAKNSKDTVAIYGNSKKKVTCKKIDSKCTFIIDVDFKGMVITNTLIKDLEKKPDVIKEVEQDVAKETEKTCMKFIEKMQKEYKVDCLELGRIACAKHGRNMDVDWNDVISKTDIKVNVKVKIDGFGRGRYADNK